MSLQEDIVALLAAAAPVFPETVAQNQAPPFIVYSRVYSGTQNILDGNGNPPINQTRLQLDCWAATYAGAQALAASVTTALLGFTTQNVKQGEQDGYEPDVKLFRVILDYSFWHYG